METLESVSDERWHTVQPIPCIDSSSHGEPRPGVRFLDTRGALRLVLHQYLNSAVFEITLWQLFLPPHRSTSCLACGFSLKACVKCPIMTQPTYCGSDTTPCCRNLYSDNPSLKQHCIMTPASLTARFHSIHLPYQPKFITASNNMFKLGAATFLVF